MRISASASCARDASTSACIACSGCGSVRGWMPAGAARQGLAASKQMARAAARAPSPRMTGVSRVVRRFLISAPPAAPTAAPATSSASAPASTTGAPHLARAGRAAIAVRAGLGAVSDALERATTAATAHGTSAPLTARALSKVASRRLPLASATLERSPARALALADSTSAAGARALASSDTLSCPLSLTELTGAALANLLPPFGGATPEGLARLDPGLVTALLEALLRRSVAVLHAAAVLGVVRPVAPVAAHVAARVRDAVLPVAVVHILGEVVVVVRVDVDVAVTPVAAAPERGAHGHADPKRQRGGRERCRRVPRRIVGIGRIGGIRPGAVDHRRIVGGHVHHLRIGRLDDDDLLLSGRSRGWWRWRWLRARRGWRGRCGRRLERDLLGHHGLLRR